MSFDLYYLYGNRIKDLARNSDAYITITSGKNKGSVGKVIWPGNFQHWLDLYGLYHYSLEPSAKITIDCGSKKITLRFSYKRKSVWASSHMTIIEAGTIPPEVVFVENNEDIDGVNPIFDQMGTEIKINDVVILSKYSQVLFGIVRKILPNNKFRYDILETKQSNTRGSMSNCLYNQSLDDVLVFDDELKNKLLIKKLES